MIIKNATVYGADFEPIKTDITIDGEVISDLSVSDKDGEDFSGCNVLPGFIDIHIHGCNMADATDGNADSAAKMSRWLATKGVTSFCPTTMTLPEAFLEKCFSYVGETIGKEEGAYIHGINMEGPFLGKDKKGAHDEQYLFPLSKELFDEWDALSDYSVRLLDLDPCLEGSLDFIRAYAGKKRISLAHTSCDYDLAAKAFLAGADHVTHLFNAMNTLYHRQPGLIGAVADYPAYAEIICDGIHIHPSVIRLMFAACGEKMVLISDSAGSRFTRW